MWKHCVQFPGVGAAAYLLAVTALVMALGGRAVAQEGARLEVSVTDASSGAALEGVELSLPEARLALVTGADGRGVFAEVPLGEHLLVVSRSGYGEERILIDFARPDTVVAEIPLHVRPVILDELIVEGRVMNPKLRAAGYYYRERRGFGSFISPEDIETWRHTTWTAAGFLRGVPGVSLREERRGTVVQSRRDPGCSLTIFIDGVRMGGSLYGGGKVGPPVIEELVSAQDVAAMEVYNGAQAPPQYSGSCGALVIWTRSRY